MSIKSQITEKLLLLVLDGCRYDTAVEQMGILNHHVDYKQAQLIKVHAEMPSSSRPLYEVLATGVPSYRNGILTNADGQHSKELSILILSKLPAEVLQLQHIIGKVNYSIKHLMKSNEIVFNMTTKKYPTWNLL